MNTIIFCALITVCYLAVFYIWGHAFLGMIGSPQSMSESVAFGYIVMQAVYQFFYLPFFFARGSYRALSVVWIIASTGITVFCIFYNWKNKENRKVKRFSAMQILLVVAAVILIAWLCALIGLHARPNYIADGFTYTNEMNEMVFQDRIFEDGGTLKIHHAFNSIFALFATPCLLTGIRPFYMSLFMMRFLAVCLTSVVAYCTGKALLDRNKEGVSWYALALSVIVPFAMMFWSSMYTGEFFYMRSNEAKAYCQLVMLPLAFMVSVEMFTDGADRDVLWKKQFAIGLAAIPIAQSSMTAYLLTIIVTAAGLLVHDRFRQSKGTLLRALPCIVPNCIYLLLYLFY